MKTKNPVVKLRGFDIVGAELKGLREEEDTGWKFDADKFHAAAIAVMFEFKGYGCVVEPQRPIFPDSNSVIRVTFLEGWDDDLYHRAEIFVGHFHDNPANAGIRITLYT